MGILKELKDEQDNEAFRLGDKWVETDRLFVKWNGEPMNNQKHKEPSAHRALPEPEVYRSCFQVM